MTAAALIVRPLQPHDEQAFLDLRAAITTDGTIFAKDYLPGMAWSEYLLVQDNARNGVGLAADTVPYTGFRTGEIAYSTVAGCRWFPTSG